MKIITLTEKDIARFWAKVEVGKENDCWEYIGSKQRGGYGQFWLGKNQLLAHRVSYVIENGNIPIHLCVCHRCDNRSCVNPRHLFLGTNQENTKDRVRKGRSATGERSGTSKLKEHHIPVIREMLRSGKSQRFIAKLFKVCQATIGDIKTGKTWTRLE